MSGTSSMGSSGRMRQRYSQGYMSSGDDLEDDACSRTPRSSLPTVQRARTWSEVLENVLWLASAVFIIYYGDRQSNFISLLWSDRRIKRMALHLGLVSVVLNVGVILYSTLSLTYPRKSYEKPEILPSVAPFVILLGFLSFCLFLFALWPIWNFLTIPLLFTLFMASIIISPYVLTGPLRPPPVVLRAD